MRKVIVLVVGALLLAGCSTGAKSALVDHSDDFIAAYESRYGEVTQEKADLLVEVGQTICQAKDEGNSWTDIAVVLITGIDDVEEAGFILGSSVQAFCPEYSSSLLNAI